MPCRTIITLSDRKAGSSRPPHAWHGTCAELLLTTMMSLATGNGTNYQPLGDKNMATPARVTKRSDDAIRRDVGACPGCRSRPTRNPIGIKVQTTADSVASPTVIGCNAEPHWRALVGYNGNEVGKRGPKLQISRGLPCGSRRALRELVIMGNSLLALLRFVKAALDLFQ